MRFVAGVAVIREAVPDNEIRARGRRVLDLCTDRVVTVDDGRAVHSENLQVTGKKLLDLPHKTVLGMCVPIDDAVPESIDGSVLRLLSLR